VEKCGRKNRDDRVPLPTIKTTEGPKGRPGAANSLSRARFRGKSAGNFGFTSNNFVPFRFKANEIFNATDSAETGNNVTR